ncbi:MAG: MMPL family transporter [Pseudomonadota bacterium]
MSAGFGLERIGLVALRFPRTTLLLILLITLPLAYFATKVGFSSDIREIFRSGTEDYARFQQVEEQYPDSGQDVLLLIKSDNLFTVENLERLRDLHLELSFARGVRDVVSMFSARHPPDEAGGAEPLFSPEITQQDLSAAKDAILEHPLVAEKLLSPHGKTTLFVIAMEPYPDIDDLRVVAAELRDVTGNMLTGSDMSVQYSGLSYLRLEIVSSLMSDQLTFISVGFLIVLLISWLFFHSITYVCVAALPSVVAVIWLAGITGLRGTQVDVMSGVVPALVIVLVVASSLHLLFKVRRQLSAGAEVYDAVDRAVREIGPACVLASLTTAIALFSLTLVPLKIVSSFGFTAAIGTAIAYIVTITVVPSLAFLLLSRVKRKKPEGSKVDFAFGTASRCCHGVSHFTLAHPRLVLACGLTLALVAGLLYAQISPRYQYREYLPERSPAHLAMNAIDGRLAGTENVFVHIQMPPGERIDAPESAELVKKVDAIVAELPLVRTVTSLHSLRTWAVAGEMTDDRFFSLLQEAQTPLIERILSLDDNSTLVTGYFPGTDAAELLPVIQQLEGQLDTLRAEYPEVTFTATSISVLSAKASYEMIAQLNKSLLLAICLNILLVGIVFRSVRAGLYCILPNLLPIVVVGGFLYLSGLGLQFTSVVAFTIGFGIAVDNTIHILNYYGLMRAKGQAVVPALDETLTTIGPVLTVGTVVLISGFAATLLSQLPNLRLFGEVAMMLLATALLANLVILPATIAILEGGPLKKVVR